MAPREVDWSKVHDQFGINRRFIWLNNCGISAMPGPVLTVMENYLRRLAEGGILEVPGETELHERVRGRLARLIGADPDELALVHHTQEGLSFVSQGLELRPGDRIVLVENEYPSNVYPWEPWREKGVELAFAPLAPSPQAFVRGLLPLLEPPTRVVSLSAVHWCTGLPLPLEAVGKLCAERDIRFVVDGAQGVGMLPLDVRRAQVDFLAFSAWKWLLGPVGLGALYIRRERLANLRFPFKGTGSVIDDHHYLPYRDTLKPGTERYVLSTPNFNDWVYFDASLDFLEGLGWGRVQGRIAALARYLGKGLRALGFTPALEDGAGADTGIVAAAPPKGREAGVLVRALADRNIIAAERLGRVRMAPHVYLLESQLDAALAACRDLVS